MEDASREFQVFMSPSMKGADQRQHKNKNRLVPVINNKVLSTTSSTFAINQRKSTVYKAVSGVSFQETDSDQKRKNRKEQKEAERGRRESRKDIYSPLESETSYSSVHCNGRSKSITSVESDNLSECSKGKVEITHPFNPIILHNRSKPSRYSRVKERDRRRSHSHVRDGKLELKLVDNSIYEDIAPVRGRRSRSASRSRKSVLTAFLNNENSLEREIMKQDRARKFEKNRSDKSRVDRKKCELIHYGNMAKPASDNIFCEPKEINLSVNDSYWRKCEEKVSKELDSLTKNGSGEEPEGGYFSLERDEIEDIDKEDFGEAFQKDHDNEAIYIKQVFHNGEGNNKKRNHAMINPEPIKSKETCLTDDEGLYEEIVYDPYSSASNSDYQVTEAYNKYNAAVHHIPVSAETKEAVSSITQSTPRIEQRRSSTVVYITGPQNQHSHVKDNLISVSIENGVTFDNNFMDSPSTNFDRSSVRDEPRQHSPVDKTIDAISRLENLYDSRASIVHVDSPRSSPLNDRVSNSSAWCSCGYDPSSVKFNHSASCLESKSSCINAKYSSFGDDISHSLESDVYSDEIFNQDVNRRAFCDAPTKENNCIQGKRAMSDITTPPYPVESPEYEMGDIDLDMFAPKAVRVERRRRKKNLFANRKEGKLPSNNFAGHGQSAFDVSERTENRNSAQKAAVYGLNSSASTSAIPKITPRKIKMISPQTFKAVLEDSIFNPTDNESVVDESEGLVINENQVITCITDSSSDDESDDDHKASPWLEANRDFEFVAFKKDNKDKSSNNKMKKSRKIISLPSIPKIFGGSLAPSSFSSSSCSQLDKMVLSDKSIRGPTPERPVRRKRRGKSSKRKETSK